MGFVKVHQFVIVLLEVDFILLLFLVFAAYQWTAMLRVASSFRCSEHLQYLEYLIHVILHFLAQRFGSHQ